MNIRNPYVEQRMRHIKRTQNEFGLRNAWIDFLIYLTEAIILGLPNGTDNTGKAE